MRMFRWVWVSLGCSLICVASAWIYTAVQLNIARARGVYSTPEQGMIAHAEQVYTADREVKILYAGMKAHVWYVIAEIRASKRADGSALGHNGCDAPGSFFLQTKEGAFPDFIGSWMEVFGWAGEGQSTPSTNWAPDQPSRF